MGLLKPPPPQLRHLAGPSPTFLEVQIDLLLCSLYCLDLSWPLSGRFWPPLAALGLSWAALGRSWPPLAALGPLLAALESLLARLGPLLARLGPLLARLGPLLGRSWALLGRSWPLLGGSWALLAEPWGIKIDFPAVLIAKIEFQKSIEKHMDKNNDFG